MKLLWLLLLFPLPCSAQLWNGVLSSSRAYDWQGNSGVVGGVPSWSACSGGTISAVGSPTSYVSPSTINTRITSNYGNNCSVVLGSGDFYLNAPIQNASTSGGVEVIGQGASSTHLHFCAPGATSNGCSGGTSWTCAGGRGVCQLGFASTDGTYGGSNPSFVNWTAGYTKGASTITVSDGTHLVAGQLLILDQCNTGRTGSTGSGICTGTDTDNGNYFNAEQAYSGSSTSWSGTGESENGPDNAGRSQDVGGVFTYYYRGQQEQPRVVSCSPACGTGGSTVVTLSHPLVHPNWASGQFPQAWWITPMTNVGFRNFSLDGTTWATTASFGIAFNNVENFWVQGVAFTNFPDISLFAAQSSDYEFQFNYIYNIGQSNQSFDSTGISLGNLFNGRIEANILQKGHAGIVPFGPFVGNVVAYNFFINPTTLDDFNFSDIWINHSNSADYNLYEGNVGNQLLSDQTHGTDLMNTSFRSFWTGFESCGNGQCGGNTAKHNNNFAIQDTSGGRYWNIVDSVLGTPQIQTVGDVYTNNSYLYFNGSGLGYTYNLASGNQSVSNAFPVDPSLIATTMLWCNWDANSTSTVCNSANVPSGISVYPNAVPTSTCTASLSCPSSFYLSAKPSWFGTQPWPGIGVDVTGGSLGQCGGSGLGASGQFTYVAAYSASQCAGQGLNAAWAGHLNPNPAMKCYLDNGGNPDGSSSAITFNAATCYPSTPPPAPGALVITGKFKGTKFQ